MVILINGVNGEVGGEGLSFAEPKDFQAGASKDDQ